MGALRMRELVMKNRIVYSCFLASVLLLLLPVYGFSQSMAQQNLTELQKHLEKYGWRVKNSLAGDLILWRSQQPKIKSGSVATTDTDPSAETIVAMDIQTLRDRLKERGWDVRLDKDGSLLAYPQSPEKTVSAAQVTGQEMQEDKRMDEIQVLLKASGWEALRDSKGDLLLFPQRQQDSSVKTTAVTVAPSDLAAAKDLLSSAGWRLQESDKGDLLLYPEQDTVNSKLNSISGLSSEVKAPVKSSKEAKLRAQSWISKNGDSSMTVGKIRKVNWVYLISIVGKSPPYRLQNQLAVRSHDGRVISLYQ